MDALTRLVRACEPNESLAPDDPRYVNCDDVRGINLVEHFARALRRSDPAKPDVKVFAGHRGVGKTSELLRLKNDLENPGGSHVRFKVIMFDVADALDVNDLDFPDLLVYTAAEVQLQLAAEKLPGFGGATRWLSRVWDELRGLAKSDVLLTGGEIDAGFGSLAIELKNRPTSRQKLRQMIEQLSTSLLGAVNDLLGVALVELRKKGWAGLVLIIDGLDKIVRRELPDGSNTHARLFIDRAEQLASLHAHTVYTVPISMIYSTEFAQLEHTFGEHNVPVPMIQIRGRNRSEPKAGTPGMRKLREIIDARCRKADVDPAHLFDDESTADFLCAMTGGHPRHLMMFLQAASNSVDALPITRAAAQQAVTNYANSLLREIPDAFWPALRKFDRPRDDIPKDDIHQRMLLLLHVFEYMNGAPWYEVNPVIKTLKKFEESGKRERKETRQARATKPKKRHGE